MTTPIFSGKGVTAAIYHDRAKGPAPNGVLWCKEYVLGLSTPWLYRNALNFVFSKHPEFRTILASETDILLSNGKKLVRIFLRQPHHRDSYGAALLLP